DMVGRVALGAQPPPLPHLRGDGVRAPLPAMDQDDITAAEAYPGISQGSLALSIAPRSDQSREPVTSNLFCSSLSPDSYSAATSRSQLRVSLSVSNASSSGFAAHQSAVSLSASACALRTSACTRGRIAAAYRCAHLSVVIAVGVRSVVMA